ncbi:uncharacterized protein (DUF433 family) [Longimicrobium terrae]|uniref:Uncharacterized protein (DUF433 family) n=2 Tax=Longimicrobium terrae TaxID=1639882 RepID=A0A841GX25_9BACT|nr:DUF433 domain-containing protein [Longimicrobium terrae]MBB4635731.1 uncharacterized protein (DUF433 family) [Longimicrobium terrae]MBB6070125.1 uncharacterized protein (DUF433 family) [Longimicrobium terrae]NNC33027.1 DUF433 domain-containing protein [Longimicrobium terrae]
MAITVNEAAFLAGVAIKAVNQAIDRKQIQSRLLRRSADHVTRVVDAGAAVFLSFSSLLAPEIRSKVYRLFRGKALAELPRRLEMGSVVIDLRQTIERFEARLDLLTRISARVESDAEVHGGDPVFAGTRIPVYSIARKLELGATREELTEDYPRLREGDIDLATQYAKLYPRRGRPRAEWTRAMKRAEDARGA